MKIMVDRMEKEITMRAWDEEKQEWTPDFFADVETDVVDGEEVTFFYFNEILLDYWTAEVAEYNEHKLSSALLDPYDPEASEEQLRRYPEVILEVK